MSNGSDTKNGALEKCGAAGSTTVVIDDIEPTNFNLLPTVLSQIEETSPRPESPTSSAESSSAVPLSTAS